jgi:cell division protein FtsI (penicillin-binding protein 3)
VGLLAARLIQVQVVQAGWRREEARSQQQRTLEIPASRGPILDRDGDPLAVTVPADRRGRHTAARLYPHGQLAAQVIGTTSADGRGLEGVELACDRLLHGRPGSRVVGADARGHRYSIPGGHTRPPEDGAAVVLTIDPTAQSVLERELEQCVEKNGAIAATGILMDPRNGDILAMCSFPSYDPQDPAESPAKYRRNRSITDIVEPGSTFKVVTAAACLEDELVDLDTRVESGETLELAGGELLRTREDRGPVTLEEMLVLSVNTATARLARLVGNERFYEYARAFGFGCITGIDLPGEVSGILRRPVHWSGRSLETLSIGQEVAVTPLQLVNAYAAIANDGVLLKPRIVREIRGPGGRTRSRIPVRTVRRIVSPATARTLTDMLTEVVESGTGRTARVAGVPIAGKTGTAQRIDPETGRYDPRRHVASFVGFFPANRPRVVGVIVVDRPSGMGWGSQVAAPCFRRVVEGVMLSGREPIDFAAVALGTD